MEFEDAVPYLQGLTVSSYPESERSSQYFPILITPQAAV